MKIRRGEGINIVPFIDIMLVLLAIVLSVSTFIAQGKIPIDIPKADQSENAKHQEKLSITIDAQNKVYLDGQETTFALLQQKINSISPKTLIELSSDKKSHFDSFVQILNILKAKKHENFAISTQKD